MIPLIKGWWIATKMTSSIRLLNSILLEGTGLFQMSPKSFLGVWRKWWWWILLLRIFFRLICIVQHKYGKYNIMIQIHFHSIDRADVINEFSMPQYLKIGKCTIFSLTTMLVLWYIYFKYLWNWIVTNFDIWYFKSIYRLISILKLKRKG